MYSHPFTLVALLVLLISSLLLTPTIASECVEEFDNCVMNRDCCQDLKCVTGDWQFTTDSTCLSTRSEQIDNLKLSQEEKVSIVEQYYNRDEVAKKLKDGEEKKKSREYVTKIVRRYDQEFPKLVSRLEAKYGYLFAFDGSHIQQDNEL